ncbi:hypothetical protein E2C01_016893 [Portunus trituberculatus]|uniref:Uncharacterized protein n=1 Tax=Portunus trituberculatus TaxID=210409 RepID=A0A5B7DQZ3_PORTR|nr:hypothetical protein [Portunus trituberculatus]
MATVELPLRTLPAAYQSRLHHAVHHSVQVGFIWRLLGHGHPDPAEGKLSNDTAHRTEILEALLYPPEASRRSGRLRGHRKPCAKSCHPRSRRVAGNARQPRPRKGALSPPAGTPSSGSTPIGTEQIRLVCLLES